MFFIWYDWFLKFCSPLEGKCSENWTVQKHTKNFNKTYMPCPNQTRKKNFLHNLLGNTSNVTWKIFDISVCFYVRNVKNIYNFIFSFVSITLLSFRFRCFSAMVPGRQSGTPNGNVFVLSCGGRLTRQLRREMFYAWKALVGENWYFLLCTTHSPSCPFALAFFKFPAFCVCDGWMLVWFGGEDGGYREVFIKDNT